MLNPSLSLSPAAALSQASRGSSLAAVLSIACDDDGRT
jgi:hypothetical protein